MVIGLVLVGVVACVSMAVAVWSLAKVNGVDSSSAQQTQVQISLSKLYSNVSSAIDLQNQQSHSDQFAHIAVQQIHAF